jgi:hypothetical protein
MSNELLEQVPVILDPITYLNAGKNNFRIEEVKNCFQMAFNLLMTNLYGKFHNPILGGQKEKENILMKLFQKKLLFP